MRELMNKSFSSARRHWTAKGRCFTEFLIHKCDRDLVGCEIRRTLLAKYKLMSETLISPSIVLQNYKMFSWLVTQSQGIQNVKQYFASSIYEVMHRPSHNISVGYAVFPSN